MDEITFNKAKDGIQVFLSTRKDEVFLIIPVHFRVHNVKMNGFQVESLAYKYINQSNTVYCIDTATIAGNQYKIEVFCQYQTIIHYITKSEPFSGWNNDVRLN